MMQAIGVVPHNAEVGRRRLHGGQTADRLIRIGNPVRVGIHRDAPDSLHGRVLGVCFNHIHIRAVRRHIHSNQLKAKILRYAEMPVVAWRGTQEFDGFLPAPGLSAVDAVGVGHGDIIKHEVQTGIPAHDYLRGFYLKDFGKELFGFGDAVQQAVVAGIHAGIGRISVACVHTVQQAEGQIQLFGAGLAAGHIQLQPHRLGLLITGAKFRRTGGQLLFRPVFQRLHESMTLPFL